MTDTPFDGFEEARRRIAREKEERTGRLDLGNLGLDRLPEEFFELEWLEELVLGGWMDLGNYAQSVNGRHPIKHAPWHPNDDQALLLQIGGLSCLGSLDLSWTNVCNLSPIAGLTTLKQLDCWGTGVQDLSPLAGLTNLTDLDCANTKVGDLSPISGLGNLTRLACGATEVDDLSPISGLVNLTELSCGGTRIQDISPIAELINLTELDCGGTQIEDLSPISRLINLTRLECGDTQVYDLSPLSGLINLTEFDCWGAEHIWDISPLSRLFNLTKLSFWGTEVDNLSPVSNLFKLTDLRCSDTLVVDLSPLVHLKKLRRLECYETLITELPDWLIQSPSLDVLIVNGTYEDISQIPGEVLSQDRHSDNCLPRLRAHLQDLAEGAEPLTDLKLVVIGNGRIGKTQLCRRLRGEPFEADADSTHGITVTSIPFSTPEGQPTTLHLWDFGGQDIYHGTHALFMRTRAIFVVVWTPDTEGGQHEHGGLSFRNHPLPYWLEYVRHFGDPHSPVILLQNQCDGGQGEAMALPVEAALLEPLQRNNRLLRRVAYSAMDESGRGALDEALRLAIAHLRRRSQPLIGRNRKHVWDRLLTWRDADAARPERERLHRLIPFAEFEGMCDEAGVHGPDTFAQVLHNAGMVYYRPGLFHDSLVLDQSWALNAIYALFHRDQPVYRLVSALGGRFTRADLHQLLWRAEGHSPEDQRSLIGMMESCGVCFVHRYEGETEYVAPDLLPEGRAAVQREIDYGWAVLPDAPLEAACRYPFLSTSIARAVIADLGRAAADRAIYWRYGVALYDARTQSNAIVEALSDPEGYAGEVRIQAKGQRPGELLGVLKERIDKLNQHSGYTAEWADGQGGEGHAHASREPDGVSIPLEICLPPPVPPSEPEVFVSYSWSQERREPLVDGMVAALVGKGYTVRLDKDDLPLGDRISRFMGRLSAGRCILLVVSAAYLRSEYCMYELYHIWRRAQQDDDAFLARVVPLVLGDAEIDKLAQRIRHAAYWKKEHQEIAGLIDEHGLSVIGVEDFRKYKLMEEFSRHVGDMLTLLADKLVPRRLDELSADDFQVLRTLVDQALR